MRKDFGRKARILPQCIRQVFDVATRIAKRQDLIRRRLFDDITDQTRSRRLRTQPHFDHFDRRLDLAARRLGRNYLRPCAKKIVRNSLNFWNRRTRCTNLQGLMAYQLQSFEQTLQVIAAPTPGQQVDFVDDDCQNRAQYRRLARHYRIERFGRRHQYIGQLRQIDRRIIARSYRHAQTRSLNRVHETAMQVVAKRLRRSHEQYRYLRRQHGFFGTPFGAAL